MKRSRILCAALSLLLLLAACGEASGPPSSGPETPPAALSSPTPAPELTPPPEASDFPNPDLSAAVFLTADVGAYTITNAEGQTLIHEEEMSGTMDILQMNEMMEVKEGRLGFTMWVPYSGRFLYERPEGQEGELWHIAAAGFPNGTFRQYFAVEGGGLGGGSAERVEYDDSGSLLIRGTPGSGWMEFTLALPDGAGLGETGHIRLRVGIAQEELWVERQGDTVAFSGLEPRYAVLSYGSYGRNVAASNIYFDLEVGSGTLDFSQAAQGQVILQEDGREARILG